MTAYVVGDLVEFNVSWLRGGHAVLNVGDLSIEAKERLGLLLDQLRFPMVQSISNLVTVVLINRYVVYLILCIYLYNPSHTVCCGIFCSSEIN